MAKKTFQSISAVSGALPIVGGYAGVMAQVGLAAVHVAEKMEGNKEIAKDLVAGISRLSKIVEDFEARSDGSQGTKSPRRSRSRKRRLNASKSESRSGRLQVTWRKHSQQLTKTKH
ncbi:hypothetical protein M407DRAFT_114013 [Tulasnella calospora MUT 4182]|uniref:Uncharacterized protein n=1 Tax=Tulasnella calospora MUT 4182 TaxID=1051891 RepID=A0A0C3QDR7_9AGAM|nr:hypothetical protein M407DRAFT_114013 [Tulasnella calospora MUT 4182]